MVDKNEAPEGYEAVEYDSETSDFHCNSCALASTDPDLSRLCFATPCDCYYREDRTTVYFVRRSRCMSTLLHQMGSLGEEV